MEVLVLLLVLVGLLAIGVPVAFALIAATASVFFLLDIPQVVVFQRMAGGISVFSLMAIPFFIFAGDLMYRSGVSARLVEVADAVLGRSRGGLGQVTVGASMMFGAVSGSAVASTSAMGSALTPLMVQRGYDRDYAANVTATAGIVGLLIPPSHNMIIYAAASPVSVSIGDLFLAGVLPGLLTGSLLMGAAYVVARRRGYPKGVFPGWPALVRAIVWAIPGLLTAVVIMGGILSGIFTATESSAVAVIYTMLVGLAVYQTVGLAKLWESAKASIRVTAMVLLIVASATAFGFALAILNAPAELGELVKSVSDNPIIVLLLINIILLLLGTFMDMAPLIVIMTPILLPVSMEMGVDPVHFGIIMMLNLGIGLVTPPVGAVLFVGSAVAKVKLETMLRTIWPFYLMLVLGLLAITFIPELSLWLPGQFD